MDIYTTNLGDFRPTRLYIKELNGLKYFGKSVSADIEKYHGSGKRWLNHIKKYGTNKIETIWISDWFYDPLLLKEYATSFSIKHSIVDSDEWANLCVETGLNGGYRENNHFKEFNKLPKTPEIRKKISDSCRIASTGKVKSEETKNKISKTLKQSMKGLLFWNNGIVNKRAKSCPGVEWSRGKIKLV
jgi:hypothetical protein